MSAGKNSTVLLRTARHCRYEQAADQNEQTACILCLQRRSVTALYRDIQPCEGAGAPPHRPDVPLRGGRRPTRQSREGSYVFAGSAQLSGQVLRDCHVASLLGMTRQASAAVHQCLSAVECSPYWAVTDRRYIFLSSGGLCRDRRCGRNRPIHPDRYSVHHAGTQPGHSDSFPAACFSCCFFRVFPA